MNIEARMTAVINREKKKPLQRALLRAVSTVYCVGSSVHGKAFETILPKAKLSIPVISVGNIVAGGSGKTPLVHYLASALAPKKVAILSRGYKRESNETLSVSEKMNARECGDEPKLLKHKLPKALVIVGKDRALSGRFAVEQKAELVLLDDGLQHHKLHRDVEIVAIDAQDLNMQGHFVPHAYLRSHPKILARADLIAIMGVQDHRHFERMQKQLRKWTDCPLTSMEASFANAAQVAGKPIGALCAIARPSRFLRALEGFGCSVVASFLKSDHAPFSLLEMNQFAALAREKGAECLVCTEKDAMKWSIPPCLELPMIPLEMSVVPQFGKEHLETIIYGVGS